MFIHLFCNPGPPTSTGRQERPRFTCPAGSGQHLPYSGQLLPSDSIGAAFSAKHFRRDSRHTHSSATTLVHVPYIKERGSFSSVLRIEADSERDEGSQSPPLAALSASCTKLLSPGINRCRMHRYLTRRFLSRSAQNALTIDHPPPKEQSLATASRTHCPRSRADVLTTKHPA